MQKLKQELGTQNVLDQKDMGLTAVYPRALNAVAMMLGREFSITVICIFKDAYLVILTDNVMTELLSLTGIEFRVTIKPPLFMCQYLGNIYSILF